VRTAIIIIFQPLVWKYLDPCRTENFLKFDLFSLKHCKNCVPNPGRWPEFATASNGGPPQCGPRCPFWHRDPGNRVSRSLAKPVQIYSLYRKISPPLRFEENLASTSAGRISLCWYGRFETHRFRHLLSDAKCWMSFVGRFLLPKNRKFKTKTIILSKFN